MSQKMKWSEANLEQKLIDRIAIQPFMLSSITFSPQKSTFTKLPPTWCSWEETLQQNEGLNNNYIYKQSKFWNLNYYISTSISQILLTHMNISRYFKCPNCLYKKKIESNYAAVAPLKYINRVSSEIWTTISPLPFHKFC